MIGSEEQTARVSLTNQC